MTILNNSFDFSNIKTGFNAVDANYQFHTLCLKKQYKSAVILYQRFLNDININDEIFYNVANDILHGNLNDRNHMFSIYFLRFLIKRNKKFKAIFDNFISSLNNTELKKVFRMKNLTAKIKFNCEECVNNINKTGNNVNKTGNNVNKTNNNCNGNIILNCGHKTCSKCMINNFTDERKCYKCHELFKVEHSYIRT